jgi:hypothetical protein
VKAYAPQGINVGVNLRLVPATGITLSAAHSNGSSVLSFLTQAGVIYRVFYAGNLGEPWTLLATVPGDGTAKSINDNSSAATRFYKVVAP